MTIVPKVRQAYNIKAIHCDDHPVKRHGNGNQVIPWAEDFAPGAQAAQVTAGGVALLYPLQVVAIRLENNCGNSCPEPEDFPPPEKG